MKVLVTGGVRSGKSIHAEELLAGREHVTYVAPGPVQDDDDWEDRIAAHQARRPKTWTTRETIDIAKAVDASPGPVLIDCLGTWLTAVLDEGKLWDEPHADVARQIDRKLLELAVALFPRDDVVIVTNEVGLGIVPSHRSGRLFRDLLGRANQVLADECNEVHLVVAGRVLKLG